MQEVARILMVDDHPVILEGYLRILGTLESKEFQPILETASSCEEVIYKIETEEKVFDYVFLDIGLPPAVEDGVYSGEDLGVRIKEKLPKAKLFIITMFNDNLRILSVLQTLKPEAFLIKSEINATELLQAFQKVRQGEIYNSYTIQNFMRKQVVSDFSFDKIDREILYYISKGVRTKDLTQHIPCSLTTIEKRKKALRRAFAVDDNRDISLINKAQELGFI